MDIANLVPEIAKAIGISPTTLLLLVMIITTAAKATARRIPDTATGWLGFVRRVCKVIGVQVNSQIAPGITMNDIAKASLAVPRIAENVVTKKDDEELQEQLRKALDSDALKRSV